MVDPDVLALYKSEDGYSAIRDWYDALLEQVSKYRSNRAT